MPISLSLPSLQAHSKVLFFILSLYFVATWSSMAAMEFFGWLLFILTACYCWRVSRQADPEVSGFPKQLHNTANSLRSVHLGDMFSLLPWRMLILFFFLTAVGIFINGTEQADRVFIIGSQRWVFLFVTHSIALTLWPPTLRGYRFFLGFTLVIGIYAIYQSFTGIDLLRPGENRAVQPIDLPNVVVHIWRSAGLFGSPMAYMYIVGQYACLIVAVSLTQGIRKSDPSIWKWSVFASLVVTASLFTTYVRGGWIGIFLAYLTMAYFASRRLAVVMFSTVLGGVALSAVFVEAFRLRLTTLFDSGFRSNLDRLRLWEMNFKMFQDYPIFGIGWEENETRAREYLIAMGHPHAFGGHAHNNYIQVLAGMGITGFVVYMSLIIYMFVLNLRLIRSLPHSHPWARALALGCFGAQIQLHVGGFTECNFKAGATNHNFMVVWGLVIALTYLQKQSLLETWLPRTAQGKKL